MRNNSMLKKSIVALIFIFTISIGVSFAQPGDPAGDPVGGGGGPIGLGVPLDGGSLLLLIAGLTYGAKQLKKKKEIVAE
jgi:hypothetical protein